MKTFPNFSEKAVCRVCGTKDDKECVLIPVDGTEVGGNVKVTPVHVDCLQADSFRYSEKLHIFYKGGF